MLARLCCFGTDLCKCECLGLTRNKNVKIGYIIIFLVGFFCALLLNSGNITRQTIEKYDCENWEYGQDCIQMKNITIIFFAIAFMHLIIMCSMFCKTEKVKTINEGIWFIKLLVAVAFGLLLYLLKGSSMVEFMVFFSEWTSHLVYFFIAIVFVDLIYSMSINLDQKAQQNSKIHILKAILSFSALIASAVVIFLGWDFNESYVSWTNLILTFVFLVVAILRIFPGNAIFVSSFVSLAFSFVGYYVYPLDIYHNPLLLSIMQGLFVLFLLVGMLCEGSSKLRTRKSTLNQLLALNTSRSDEDNRYVSSNKWTVYHYIMVIIAIGVPSMLFSQQLIEEKGDISKWAQVSHFTWWISIILLYVWSLIASKLFPQKDFSDLENYFREYELN